MRVTMRMSVLMIMLVMMTFDPGFAFATAADGAHSSHSLINTFEL
jgi:hypothetical protein